MQFVSFSVYCKIKRKKRREESVHEMNKEINDFKHRKNNKKICNKNIQKYKKNYIYFVLIRKPLQVYVGLVLTTIYTKIIKKYLPQNVFKKDR